MLLHNDKAKFKELVSLTADYFGLRDYQVEKDYFVSVLLRELSRRNQIQIVFKGGTSLSKSYQVIERFSEDIDIALLTNSETVNQRTKKELKALIVESVRSVGMEIINQNEIFSRRDFNAYKIKFDSLFTSNRNMISDIIIETITSYKPFPNKIMKVRNFILNFLEKNDHSILVNEFKLAPFSMLVQSIERTFLDKIFALCDYHLEGNYNRYSRHLYDLHMIWSSQKMDMELMTSILPRVVNDRNRFEKRNPSSKKGTQIVKILEDIIETEVYKDDYLSITSQMIYNAVTYETCIQSIHSILEHDFLPKIIN